VVKISGLFLVLAPSGLALLGGLARTDQVSGERLPKTDVCHVDELGVARLINISQNAFQSHLDHGDAMPGEPVPGKPGFVFGPTCAQVSLSSCAAIRAFDSTAGDGNYTIVAGQSFKVFCHDMAGTPREYLNLQSTPSSNFAQYTAGGATTGDTLRTTFTKVRIDPITLTVDIFDGTFSSSTGGVCHSCETTGTQFSYFQPYGVAADCLGLLSATGIANVNLTGTPFKVIDPFVTAGWFPGGSVVKSSSDQIVDLTGGGYCGATSPTDDILNLAFLP
jgi:hypothetical protein